MVWLPYKRRALNAEAEVAFCHRQLGEYIEAVQLAEERAEIAEAERDRLRSNLLNLRVVALESRQWVEACDARSSSDALSRTLLRLNAALDDSKQALASREEVKA